MIKESHLELVRTHGSKFGRVLLGLLFLVSGLLMLTVQGPAAIGGYFASLGIPLAGVVAWVVIIFKIVAGGAVVIGKRTTEAAAGLIVFTLIATLLGHLSAEVDPTFPIGLLKNLAIVGGLLYLMAFGPHGMNVIGDDPWEKTNQAS
ncbi:MAG: DoxX family protein [Patescibacteria group bacterium]